MEWGRRAPLDPTPQAAPVTQIETHFQPDRTTLANGITVLTETMPYVRSVSVGIWFDTGSRHESQIDAGLTHFSEHMVFKGSAKRTSEEIAFAVDGIGGHLDAFTTKESMAFTAKVLEEHLPLAFDVVADMVRRPTFPENELAKEKGVVLEELKMDEDSPDYLIYDLFSSSFWSDQPLGRPIIGNTHSIESFDRSRLADFYRGACQPQHLMVTAVGRLEHDRVGRLVEDQFGDLTNGSLRPAQPTPQATPAIVLRDKPSLEQTHLCLGVEVHSMTDPRRFASYLLSTLLGGGVSSRLFLKIREQAGLAYSVYSDLSLYADAGCLSVYAGTSLETTRQVISQVLAEFRDLKDNRVQDAELRRAKDHLKGSLMLSLESTSSRMSNLARQHKYFGRTFSLDEITDGIEAVTAEQIRDLALEWFSTEKVSLAVLGDLQGLQIERAELAC